MKETDKKRDSKAKWKLEAKKSADERKAEIALAFFKSGNKDMVELQKALEAAES